MSGLTVISRVAGLVRDKAWSYFLGANWQFSAFWMGFQFPNLSRRIFGEGALTAAFVPLYTELLHKEGKAAASRFASVIVTMLITVLGLLTLVGEAIAIPIALNSDVTVPNRTAAAMIAIMLPYCMMICLVAILGAIATVHEKFTAQSLNPIVLNLVTALGAALAVLVMTRGYPVEKRIFWVAGSVLVAGLLQVLLMVPTIRASGVQLRAISGGAEWKADAVRRLLASFLPIMVASSAVQINTFMDTQIAWWLSPDGHDGRHIFTLLGHLIEVPMGKGAGAKLSMAQRIYLLPVGIFGVSMAMAVFPPMARAAAGGDMTELKRLLVAGLKKTLFLSIPSSLGMILVARPLLTLVYLGGEVTPGDIDRAYWAAIFFCIGIWAFEAQMVILRVFFVLKDTRTPMAVSLLMIVLNFGLNLTLVWFLQEGGIALATTTAAILQGAILLMILRRRLGTLGVSALLSNVGKSTLCAAVMVMAGWLLLQIPMPWEGEDVRDVRAKILTAVVKLPLLVGVCGAVYIGLTRWLGMAEVGDLPVVGRILRRRG
jgi:putative peptidoglycan lipid II flippase